MLVNESLQLFLESFWPIVLGGLTGTIPLALASFAIGLVLALAVALMRLSKNRCSRTSRGSTYR